MAISENEIAGGLHLREDEGRGSEENFSGFPLEFQIVLTIMKLGRNAVVIAMAEYFEIHMDTAEPPVSGVLR